MPFELIPAQGSDFKENVNITLWNLYQENEWIPAKKVKILIEYTLCQIVLTSVDSIIGNF